MGKMNVAMLSQDESVDGEISHEDIVTPRSIEELIIGEPNYGPNVKQIAVEIDQLQQSINEGFQTTQAMEAMRAQIDQARHTGGISQPGAQAIIVAVEHMRARLGFKREVKLATEGFSKPVDKLTALNIASESITATIKSIWQAIIDAIVRIGQWIKGFFMALFDKKGRQAAQIKTAQSACASAAKMTNKLSPAAKAIVKKIEEENKPAQQRVKTNSQFLSEKELEIAEICMQLPLKDFPFLCYRDAPVKMTDLGELLGQFENDIFKMHLIHSKRESIDQVVQSIDDILSNIDQIESRHIALSNLVAAESFETLGKNSEKTYSDDGLRRTQSDLFLGDYAKVVIDVESDDLNEVEKHLSDYSIRFEKIAPKHAVNDELLLQRLPAELGEKILKKLEIFSEALSQKDIQYLEEKYTDLLDKSNALARAAMSDASPNAEIASIAMATVNAFKSTYVDYLSTTELYIVGLANNLARYAAICAKKEEHLCLIASALAEESQS